MRPASLIRMLSAAFALALAACGDDLPGVDTPGDAGSAAPDAELATRWPILLSHPWSHTAESAFLDDARNPWGLKALLEARGAVVYQPDKLRYAGHEPRGRLLYRKCAGSSRRDMLCEGDEAEAIDGVHLAVEHYCGHAEWRARSGFDTEQSCREGLQFNIICHSQGCPDSRYMMVAVTNEHSGLPMYRHVASWTSMAGANKGTALADFALELSAACVLPECRSMVLDAMFGTSGSEADDASESLVALSRYYMMDSMDIDLGARLQCLLPGQDCAPSFNEAYPLPEDPEHPILYQAFVMQIDDITHPCYEGLRLFHDVIALREGTNDGYISVESQAFETYGRDGSGGRTPVIVRELTGESLDPAIPHPGLDHMAPGTSRVPGMDGVSCDGEDNSMFRFSRDQLYLDVVRDLVELGL